MKLVLLIMSCKNYRETRQAAVRNTWLKHISPEITYIFFEGTDATEQATEYHPEENRLIVNCPDTYQHLALKCKLAMEYVVRELNPDYIIKCDDDTYINPERLNTLIPEEVDYIGHRRRVRARRTVRYADGGCYILSSNAAKLIADYDFSKGEGRCWWYGAGANDKNWCASEQLKKESSIEDMMIGDILNQNGIPIVHGSSILYSCCRASSEYDEDYTDLDFKYLAYHPVLPDAMVIVYETQMAGNYE
jgi:hypothetical protein